MQQDRFRPRYSGPTGGGNSASSSSSIPSSSTSHRQSSVRNIEETWTDISSGGEDIITEGLRVAHSSQSTRRSETTRRSLEEHRRRRRSSARSTATVRPRDRILESEFLEIFSSEDEEGQNTSEFEILPGPNANSGSQFGEFLREEDYSSSSAMLSSQSSSEGDSGDDSAPSPPTYTQLQRPTLRSRPTAPPQRYSQQQAPVLPPISPQQQQQFDHDAALRASLSTLLSCAAAARNRPTPKEPQQHSPLAGPSNLAPPPPPQLQQRVQVETLTLLPGSALPPTNATPHLKRSPATSKPHSRSRSPRRRSRRSSSHSDASTILSEVFSYVGGGGGEGNSSSVNTTLIALGAVVLFSALSFSAGYALGKQTGNAEMVVGWGGKEEVSRGLGLVVGGKSGGISV